MSQARQTQSEAKIKAAFITLLDKKSFSEVSISDITRLAGINRGTFYLHYLDKNDLADSIAQEVTQRFAAIFTNNSFANQDSITKALYHIKQEYVSFFKIVSQLSFIDFPKKVRHFLEEVIHSNPSSVKKIKDSMQLPEIYAVSSLAAAIESIVVLWIKNGVRESPEEIASMITKIDHAFGIY
ncbi:TetR/AcrR family transcriptional regulator [Streptococcus caviae]|uniref:TetR/AcrR family transcriptional regulator n=1 Tax=Streptococcus sp. 'caviae' TaxID=1915004 RepID=UPI00094BBA1A|nr:TetR/AcrR family transcriptional regulator [Streptococcus sp. 'caviae']OLN84240.1 TetR family transcriptional regulator [Streptococcus sp. 'caviae']